MCQGARKQAKVKLFLCTSYAHVYPLPILLAHCGNDQFRFNEAFKMQMKKRKLADVVNG
jgi:hypothetical protein